MEKEHTPAEKREGSISVAAGVVDASTPAPHMAQPSNSSLTPAHASMSDVSGSLPPPGSSLPTASLTVGQSTAVATVIIHAQAVHLVQPEDRNWTQRYRTNAILFFIMMGGLAIWLKLHFENLATQHLVAGTLTAWALWKALQPLISDFKDPAQQFRQRFLSSPMATEYTVAGIIVILLLFLTTASVTVRLAGGSSDVQQVTIRLTTDRGRAVVPDMKVTPLTPVISRPLFGRFSTERVMAQVLDPAGYDAKAVRIRPWTSLALHFPDSFTAHPYHIVRIVPGVSLAHIPQPEDPSEQYALIIRGPKGEHRYPDYRYHTIYFGASKNDLDRLIPTYSGDEFRNELHDHLVRRGVPQQGRDSYLSAWTDPVRTLPTPEYQDVDVTIVIRRRDEPPLLEYPLRIGRDPLKSIVLERSQ